MIAYTDKTSHNKTEAVVNTSIQKQNSALSFTDNRSTTIAQRKLQEAIIKSPRIQQLSAYQEMANGSQQATRMKAYQAKANDFIGKTVQRKGINEDEPIHKKFAPIQKKENNTGMPDDLKTGIENLSGYDMSDVRVHYNSDKPAQLQAHAYAQGTNIHIAPGQERHLPHEAWHVVQQKQDRVRATMQMKGMGVNNDVGLEREADVMGGKAVSKTQSNAVNGPLNNVAEAINKSKLISTSLSKILPLDIVQRVNTPDKPVTTLLTPAALAERNREVVNDLNTGRYWSEVIFSNGLVYKKTGDIEGRLASARLVDGKVIFAYGTNGQIYIRSEKHGVSRADGFTHANFLSGGAVQTAGQMFIRMGQITRLDNESGHYKPLPGTLEWLLPKLQMEGVQLSKVTLVLTDADGSRSYDAQKYLTESTIDNVPLIDPELKKKDEDFQMQYDAHIGHNTIRFEYFGWPYGNLRQWEWEAKMALIKQRCDLGQVVNVEIEFSRLETRPDKTKAAAKVALNTLVHQLQLVEFYREVRPTDHNKGLLTVAVRSIQH